MIRNNFPLMLLLGVIALLVGLALIGDILLPFVLGAALAYFFDPAIDRLERLRIPRPIATTILVIFILFAFTVLIAYGVPLFVPQFNELASHLSGYAQDLQIWAGMHADILPSMEEIFANLQGLATRLLRSSGAVFGFLPILLITPIVAIYLANDWDRLVAAIDALLPEKQAPRLRTLAREIDEVLSGFVRGQITVCALLAIFYAACLGFIGIKGGIVVGILAGLLAFIPYVGTTIGILLSLFLGIGQYGMEPTIIALILTTFGVGQFLEGNILTPRLTGDKVRLHPVWILFALLVLSNLLGFLGLLLAVPAAAMIGVLVRAAYADAVSK